ncbi:MAG: hypothetical protein IT265_07055 [Saprospiraceae bacterium]|nr:hypothetical protein [Saprospiraceae bacterium]
MKKNTKHILLSLILVGAAFLYWQNNKKIEILKLKLKEFKNYPPPPPQSPQHNPTDWTAWIDTALRLYGSVAPLFKEGGPFYKNKNAPTEEQVLDIWNANGGAEHYA